MRRISRRMVNAWLALGPRFLPFADAASAELPLGRLLRLSLFQVSVGMAMVLLTGTLNRVMIVELGVSAAVVAVMVSLPLLVAPFRALIGFRSDTHRSALGWRRVPFIWMGTLLQFGGLAIMPFSLLILSGDTHGPLWVGHVSAALAFLLVGAGMHTVQTAGLALATDVAPQATRPRVVALLYVMLLVGMLGSALVFSVLLDAFSQLRLIQVVQGAAVFTMVVNVLALWKQEVRRPTSRAERAAPRDSFAQAWEQFRGAGRRGRFLVAVALGSAAFSMQDVLLEPYGAEVLGMAVSQTTMLTALLALGTLAAFALAARRLSRGADPLRLAGFGAACGLAAFACVLLAAPLASAGLFRVGTVLIGLGAGAFLIGTLTAAMSMAGDGRSGLALGAWGAVNATAVGLAVGVGGVLRDAVNVLAVHGELGVALNGPATGYGVVYATEMMLLLATLVAVGPLVQRFGSAPAGRLGLAQFPG